jgi:hypothetical protein
VICLDEAARERRHTFPHSSAAKIASVRMSKFNDIAGSLTAGLLFNLSANGVHIALRQS